MRLKRGSAKFMEAPSLSNIKYWIIEFKRGRRSIFIEHHPDRPNEVTTTEIIQKPTINDRRLKVRETLSFAPDGIFGDPKGANGMIFGGC